MVNFFILPFLISFFANADMSMNMEMAGAKLAAPVRISSAATIAYYQKQQSQKKLNPEESEIFSLVQIAKQVFAITDFTIYGGARSEEDKARNVSLSVVAQSIQSAINLRDWNHALSKADSEKVAKLRDLIKKELGENSLAMAWLIYQGGDKDAAKKILNNGFTKSYEETMKLKRIYGGGSNLMYDGESFSKALTPLSTEQENKSRTEKLQKMRTHLSNLPDMQMMT